MKDVLMNRVGNCADEVMSTDHMFVCPSTPACVRLITERTDLQTDRLSLCYVIVCLSVSVCMSISSVNRRTQAGADGQRDKKAYFL